MSTEQEAAQSLIARAFSAGSQPEAWLLIDAARRADPAVNTDALKSQWLEQWLEANKNRNGESSQ